MADQTADVVICGAGITGIAAAYHLAVKHGVKNVVLVDEREPLTFTSDKSTECYRNWWPGPGDTMVRFMNRSIDLLEELAHESDNYFGLNRRGYVFLTADPRQAAAFKQSAYEISQLGAGPVREHHGLPGDPPYVPHAAEGFTGQPAGADLVLEPTLIQERFPFITDKAIAMLHPRRCGWLSAQQLGMYLLAQARKHGVQLLNGCVADVAVANGRVESVEVTLDSGPACIQTRCFVNAAGPYLRRTGRVLGLELPVINELHGKISIKDPLGIIPRDAPLVIWSDPVHLTWSDEEREELAAHEETHWLLEQFPAGVHFRPEGGADSPILLILWTYHLEPQEVIWPPRFDPEYAEIVLRGLVNMVPGLAEYVGRMGKPFIDGGYYCKTQENRPLIGPLPVEGAYVFGAVSGYGIMASMAGGELLAAHVTGSHLPDYAPAFHLSRYHDPAYQKLLANWDATSGQL